MIQKRKVVVQRFKKLVRKVIFNISRIKIKNKLIGMQLRENAALKI